MKKHNKGEARQASCFNRLLRGLAFLSLFAFPSGAKGLEVGSDAPPFELLGSDGKVHKLSDYKGRKAVVLAWFPKAFTPG